MSDMTERLRCSRCDKRLSRKMARMIDGEVLCSTCMFSPPNTKGKIA